MVTNPTLTEVAKITDDGCSSYYSFLPSLIKERKFESGIEIGVLFGGHALALLESPWLKTLIGIDPYVQYEPGIWGLNTQEDYDMAYEFMLERLSDPRYFHYRGTSDQASTLLERSAKHDFVFIDGLHTYDQVKKDLYNYSKIIRLDGIIACHDYAHPNYPGVTTAIDEFAELHNAEIHTLFNHLIYIDKKW
jgi:predicted O-methyltransferase YrrM